VVVSHGAGNIGPLAGARNRPGSERRQARTRRARRGWLLVAEKLARSIDDVLPELTRAAVEAARLLEPAAFNDHPAIAELLVEAGLPLPDAEDAPVRMLRLATRSGAAYRL
jgi:hypothetical protein